MQYILNQVNVLEDNVKQSWAVKRPRDNLGKDYLNHYDFFDFIDPVVWLIYTFCVGNCFGTARGSSADRTAGGTFTAFDITRKLINGSVDQICEFLGIYHCNYSYLRTYQREWGIFVSFMYKCWKGFENGFNCLCVSLWKTNRKPIRFQNN